LLINCTAFAENAGCKPAFIQNYLKLLVHLGILWKKSNNPSLAQPSVIPAGRPPAYAGKTEGDFAKPAEMRVFCPQRNRAKQIIV